MGREMHWIRIDRYETGDPENPTVSQQPMLCQHCDNAPCENVCPVNATAHSPEGLNEQVYNRCVGHAVLREQLPLQGAALQLLRLHEAAARATRSQELVYNPQVTVRVARRDGEVHLLRAAHQRGEVQGGRTPARSSRTATIQTACQQACPAERDRLRRRERPGERRSPSMRASSLAYHVLEELNVRPNVTYLARVRNPHPSSATAT